MSINNLINSSGVSNTSRKNGKYIYRYTCMVGLTLIAAALFLYNWYGFVNGDLWRESSKPFGSQFLLGLGNLGMATGIYMILYMIIGAWLQAFSIGVHRKANVLAGQVLTLFLVNFIEVFISCAITRQFRFFFDFTKMYLFITAIQAVINCIITIPMIDLYRKLFPPLQIIEIYGDHTNDLAEKINGVHYKYHVVDRVSCSENANDIRDRIRIYDAVLLNDLPAQEENTMLKICFEGQKRVYFVPKIADILVKNARELNLIDAPLFLNKNNGISPRQRFVKRVFDIVISIIALIILSPLMIMTALAIHLEDRGPVFYKQERVTLGGRRFMILKFRSMIVDAEKDGRPRPAGAKDDRITKVGRIIRACRIDELPQLLNILLGDMSIVGPRPERWEHVEKYCKDIPEFNYRHMMKGGLTGYAQVYGRYNTTALDKLKLDLLYITNYSFLLDMQIVFETVKILVQKESTEGFSDERQQEMTNNKQ